MWSRSRSRSRRQKSISLDGRENLNSFKKLVSTIEKSRSRSRFLDFVSIEIFRDKSRLLWLFVLFVDFSRISRVFLDLDREIMDFYKYLDWDFSSQPYLFTFCASKLASKWAKSVGNSNFFQKVATKISIYLEIILINCKNLKNLDLSWKSRLVLTILIKILTHPSLNWKVSILKILTKIKKSDLDKMDNLDGFQKLVSTRRTFSISIGLDCRDPQP